MIPNNIYDKITTPTRHGGLYFKLICLVFCGEMWLYWLAYSYYSSVCVFLISN